MFGCSTFGIAMTLLKWFPLRLVDKFLILMCNSILGKTEKLGLRRPKTGPIELKNATGKTPILDGGALSHIKSGKIKEMVGVKEITRNGAKFMDGQEREFDANDSNPLKGKTTKFERCALQEAQRAAKAAGKGFNESGAHPKTTMTGTMVGVDVTWVEKIWRTFQSIGDWTEAFSSS
ncbi:hypothetical protein POM88_041243 [Heracleum sosnowskyi]|uniref:Uncharacterized protein n=1 Tax=Heracleum sosnowskyi TaxID=360622 RepID=A0AAD8HGF4_9APIA|nr:hypothetical protein POM88_041243 [Heracleum sosnowskyi]